MTPTMTPLARTTIRTRESVAPSEASIPSERSRRCASTVKPPTATRVMRSIPTVSAAIEMLSGLSVLGGTAAEAVWTFGPRECGLAPGASNRTLTWVGALTWPGTTRANSSSRLCGFSTMPVTVRVRPPWCQPSPTLRWNADATPPVTATWPGLAG